MHIRFYRDPETGEPHIYNHRVTADEAEDVIRRPGEDRPGREGSRIAIGQTRAGRFPSLAYHRGMLRRRALNEFSDLCPDSAAFMMKKRMD
jgi:hypothetical protein